MQIGRSVSDCTSWIALASSSGSSVSGHAHVDVEDVGAALDLGLHVALDGGEVAGAQLLLEDPPSGGVDPLADQAEPLAVPDHDLLGGRPEDGLVCHAGTLLRFSWSSALARLTVWEASAA